MGQNYLEIFQLLKNKYRYFFFLKKICEIRQNSKKFEFHSFLKKIKKSTNIFSFDEYLEAPPLPGKKHWYLNIEFLLFAPQKWN